MIKLLDMSKNILSIITGFSICFVLVTCTKDQKIPLGATNRVLISTADVQSVTSDSSLGGGNILSDGGDSVMERGVCWATVDTPLATSNERTIDGRGKGGYTSLIKPLKPNTTYYVRAYLKNAQGVIYGRSLSFRTPSRVPTVVTDPATSITHVSANVGGNITSDGGATIVQRGVYWSETNPSPNRNDSILVVGNGLGSFSGLLSRLKGGRTYYVRAWASNSVGIGFAPNVVSFTTQPPKIPILGPTTAGSVAWITADANSSLISNEGSEITQYGFCWSRQPNPTVAVPDKRTATGNISGTFTLPISGLSPNTTYHVRAFALNEAGYGYSALSFQFTTLAQTVPKVTLTQVNATGTREGIASALVSDDGGSAVTSRGVFVNTTNPPGVNSPSYSSSGGGIGAFNVTINSLAAGVRYYVRAYAVNNIGVGLSPETLSFQTLPPSIPTVTTNTAIQSGLGPTSVVAGGTVVSDGTGIVSERGICFGLNSLPDISGNRVVMGSGLGNFSGTLTGLTPDTRYFYRAYAINGGGAGYGSVSSFVTLLQAPVLSSPASSAVVNCCTRTFAWTQVLGATRYEIQISKNNAFTNPLNIGVCGGATVLTAGFTNWAFTSTNSFCINTGSNINNGIWYWRVRALNDNNSSDWSAVNNFSYSW
jgi:hypothetical protein